MSIWVIIALPLRYRLILLTPVSIHCLLLRAANEASIYAEQYSLSVWASTLSARLRERGGWSPNGSQARRMWLLTTDRAELVWFDNPPQKYAILSHVWLKGTPSREQSFQDVRAIHERSRRAG